MAYDKRFIESIRKRVPAIQHLWSGGLAGATSGGGFDVGSGGGGGGSSPNWDIGVPGGGGGGTDLPEWASNPGEAARKGFPGAVGEGISNANPFKAATSNFNATVPGINKVDYASQIPGLASDPSSIVHTGSADARGADQSEFLGMLRGQMNDPNNPQAQMLRNQLNTTTQNNIRQNAGMIASTKGINPALAARLAGQNAAAANQQAAGQGANLALAQQLGAQGQYGNALAGQRQQDLETALGRTTAGNQVLNTLVQGNTGQNQAINTGSLGSQDINSKVSIANTAGKNGMMGGLFNAAGGILGHLLQGGAAPQGPGQTPGQTGDTTPADNGSAAPSGGEWTGGNFAGGGRVPGRAPYPGDDPRNDDVDATLSKGEIVLPNSVTQSDDPAAAAKRFVAAIESKKAAGAGDSAGHMKKIQAIKKQLAALEAQLGKKAA